MEAVSRLAALDRYEALRAIARYCGDAKLQDRSRHASVGPGFLGSAGARRSRHGASVPSSLIQSVRRL